MRLESVRKLISFYHVGYDIQRTSDAPHYAGARGDAIVSSNGNSCLLQTLHIVEALVVAALGK